MNWSSFWIGVATCAGILVLFDLVIFGLAWRRAPEVKE